MEHLDRRFRSTKMLSFFIIFLVFSTNLSANAQVANVQAQQVPIQQQPIAQAQIPTQQVPHQAQLDGMQNQQALPQGQMPNQNQQLNQVPNQAAQGIPPQPQVPQQVPTQQVPQQQQVPIQQVPMQQVPMQQVPMQQVPMQQVPMQQVPMQQAPMQQVPMQQVPMQQVPVQQAPMHQVSVQQVPMQQVPPGQAPMQQVHPGQAPLQQPHPGQVPIQMSGQVPMQPMPGQMPPVQQFHPDQIPMQPMPGQIPMQPIHPGQVPMQPMHPGQVPMQPMHPGQGPNQPTAHPPMTVPLFDENNNDAPAVAMEYKVHVDPGKEECYFQFVQKGATIYVSFQVLRGGDGMAGFAVRNPTGQLVHPYQWKPASEFQEVSPTGGYYGICVDNQFSRFAAKLVNLYITTFRYDQWEKFTQELRDIDVSAENCTNILSGVDKRIQNILQMQQLARSKEARDYNLLLDNESYVQYWSVAQCIVVIACFIVQVYFVKKLFDPKNERRGRI